MPSKRRTPKGTAGGRSSLSASLPDSSSYGAHKQAQTPPAHDRIHVCRICSTVNLFHSDSLESAHRKVLTHMLEAHPEPQETALRARGLCTRNCVSALQKEESESRIRYGEVAKRRIPRTYTPEEIERQERLLNILFPE